MEVFVVGKGLSDVAFDAVDRQVHAAERNRGLDLLLAVDGKLG